ncbi:MAG: HAMP domain-containing protein [Conexibacteraceae bacterium]|nr:HAMP domain-containing protein [Conexibacteraceae bacterium]
MADTGSDASGEPRRGVRLTLRLRLTLLYGSVFIAAGAGLLAATYALFKQSQSTSSRTIAIRAVQFQLPAAAYPFTVPAAGSGHVTVTTHPPRAVLTTRPGTGNTVLRGAPQAQQLIKRIRTSGQNQLAALVQRANFRLRTERANDASSLLLWSAVALGVVALLSIGLAWWLAGRALRPLRTMNRRARAISAENLNERLGVEDRHDELGELASTFDALLARLEAAFDSQRRFVANASHELRTPLTLERTLAEVALADPHASTASLRRVCERVVASTEQQERLLDALLTLARSEAGVTAGESVDLGVLVHDALLAREAQLAGIAVEVDERGPAVVVGDTALLELLVANLLDNAIVHNGGEDPWIRVSTGEFDGAPGLRIANGGEAVPADRVPELFEPFRRGSGERVSGRDDGLGLGLSIVRAVASAHSARIEGRALPGGGLEFELRFTPVASRVGVRI